MRMNKTALIDHFICLFTCFCCKILLWSSYIKMFLESSKIFFIYCNWTGHLFQHVTRYVFENVVCLCLQWLFVECIVTGSCTFSSTSSSPLVSLTFHIYFWRLLHIHWTNFNQTWHKHPLIKIYNFFWTKDFALLNGGVIANTCGRIHWGPSFRTILPLSIKLGMKGKDCREFYFHKIDTPMCWYIHYITQSCFSEKQSEKFIKNIVYVIITNIRFWINSL